MLVSSGESGEAASPPKKRSVGRPASGRVVASVLNVRLDQRQLDELRAIARERGRSIHSLLLEGCDSVIAQYRAR